MYKINAAFRNFAFFGTSAENFQILENLRGFRSIICGESFSRYSIIELKRYRPISFPYMVLTECSRASEPAALTAIPGRPARGEREREELEVRMTDRYVDVRRSFKLGLVAIKFLRSQIRP